jgi:hypothetical protein
MSFLGETADLLKVARTVLREEVMPHTTADARYEAAMVANAMAIAVREIEQGPRAREAERALLADLYGGAEGSLDELRARFCRDLRAGVFSPEREAGIRSLLHETVRARLAISNPTYGG